MFDSSVASQPFLKNLSWPVASKRWPICSFRVRPYKLSSHLGRQHQEQRPWPAPWQEHQPAFKHSSTSVVIFRPERKLFAAHPWCHTCSKKLRAKETLEGHLIKYSPNPTNSYSATLALRNSVLLLATTVDMEINSPIVIYSDSKQQNTNRLFPAITAQPPKSRRTSPWRVFNSKPLPLAKNTSNIAKCSEATENAVSAIAPTTHSCALPHISFIKEPGPIRSVKCFFP